MRERRAYVILVFISILLSLVTFLGGLQEIKTNNRKFCQIINAGVSVKVPMPTNPDKHPSRERQYENYLKVIQLGHDLGCF